jgi:chaperone BCS1
MLTSFFFPSVDDTFLEQAVSSVPKGSILLIEDIDCAFSREDEEDEGFNYPYPSMVVNPGRKRVRRSAVTLSGLLNILDGVGSEEGKIFFATVSGPSSLQFFVLFWN